MDDIYTPIKEDVICYHNFSNIFLADIKNHYHRHNAYEIYIFLKGHAKFYAEHTCYSLNEGDLVLVSPEELHRSECSSDTYYESLGVNIHPSVIQALSGPETNLFNCFNCREVGENNLIHLTADQLNICQNCINSIILLKNEQPFGYELLIPSYLTQLLVLINSIALSVSPASKNIMPKIVRTTMLYIKKHLTEQLTLSKLQSELNYNGTYISACFKQHTGLSIREYILDQRISLAKKHLENGLNVQEACLQSGFNDYANFIRSFSKMVGVSPGRYRRAN